MHHEWISQERIAQLQSKTANQEQKVSAGRKKKDGSESKAANGKGMIRVKLLSSAFRDEVGDGFTNFESGQKEKIYVLVWEIRNGG